MPHAMFTYNQRSKKMEWENCSLPSDLFRKLCSYFLPDFEDIDRCDIHKKRLLYHDLSQTTQGVEIHRWMNLMEELGWTLTSLTTVRGDYNNPIHYLFYKQEMS